MSHCRLAACHCGFESTGLAANDTKIRSLGKKGITNPVGENSDHKWGLLRETWSGAIEGDYRLRSALPLSDHFGVHDHSDLWGGAAEEAPGSTAFAGGGLKRPGFRF